MIQANELRIGNYVRDIHSENGFFKVLTLRAFTAVYGSGYSSKYESIEPIPLTEEVLLMCGFEKRDNGYPTEFIEWYEKEFPVIGVICQSEDKTYLFDENTDTLRIYYLHQLQNLYFSLTNNELITDRNE